ncbi:heterokaryon incompatibility protein-domain-containing protein [Bisporella sp. PMI_857]|nr:heterokaryon incompatibility protein-domain-containing protein [Bisporella sp. PMI_857]
MDRRTHRPLPGDSIRLLILQPGLFNDPIRCQLEQVSLSAGHTYEALSYMWGNAGDTSPMILDRTPYHITKNLECALRYLRYRESSRVLWVDAICIDQNNPDEKSEQVPMMGEIYSRATKVHAWLGEPDHEVDCVFDVLQEFRDRKRKAEVPTHFDAAEQLSFYRQLFRDIYQDKAGSLPEKSDLDDDMLHEEFNWLCPFYTRPYWRRVWIVQELVLAKLVVVYCGNKSIDFDDIYGLSLDWGSFEQGFDTGAYQLLKPHMRGWATIQTIRGLRRRREEVEWEMGEEPPYLMSVKMLEKGDVYFDEVIRVFSQYHECSLPKDRVYGFRELVQQWRENLIVNYQQSDLEVFLDVAKLDLFESEKHGGLHVAFCLWLAMGLGDREKFNDCLRQHFPATADSWRLRL